TRIRRPARTRPEISSTYTVSLCSRRPGEREFLYPSVFRFKWRDLRDVEVPFRICRHVVERAELPWRRTPLPERIEELQRFAIEDHHLCLTPVADVQESLLFVGRERRARRSRAVPAFRSLAFAADEDLRD